MKKSTKETICSLVLLLCHILELEFTCEVETDIFKVLLCHA